MHNLAANFIAMVSDGPVDTDSGPNCVSGQNFTSSQAQYENKRVIRISSGKRHDRNNPKKSTSTKLTDRIYCIYYRQIKTRENLF